MTKKLTHYKKNLDQEFLGGHDFIDDKGQPFEKTVTIDSIETVLIYEQRKDRDEKKLVLHFKEPVKKMILTNRNQRVVRSVLGTKFSEQWIGKQLTLSTREEVHFDEVMDVLKIVQKDDSKSIAVQIAELLGRNQKSMSKKEVESVQRVIRNKEKAIYNAALRLLKSKDSCRKIG